MSERIVTVALPLGDLDALLTDLDKNKLPNLRSDDSAVRAVSALTAAWKAATVPDKAAAPTYEFSVQTSARGDYVVSAFTDERDWPLDLNDVEATYLGQILRGLTPQQIAELAAALPRPA